MLGVRPVNCMALRAVISPLRQLLHTDGRGIYDVSLNVKKGETLGFLGPNGAGKSTTMRHLMGFTKPDSGTARISGMVCRQGYSRILEDVGYLPGEVSIPEGLDGNGFIAMMQGLRKSKNDERLQKLINLFPVELDMKVKRMSIGEKRKLAVITAFMNDPQILLLDEPTSGLDPMMQEVFIDFIREEKARGKTVLLSSHIFSEVEALCDRIQIIKDGKIVSILDAAEVKHGLRKTVDIAFKEQNDYNSFLSEKFEFVNKNAKDRMTSIFMEDAKTNEFLSVMQKYDISYYEEHPVSLEDYFMHFYKNDKAFGGIKNGRNH